MQDREIKKSSEQLIEKMRPLLKYDGNCDEKTIELAKCALDWLELYTPENEAAWYERMPISVSQAREVIEEDLEFFKYTRRKDETLAQAKVRLLTDTIRVESKKRDLLWEFANVFSQEEAVLFKKAQDFATFAHKGQMRDSGEPYIIHPIEVAQQILHMDMDSEAVIAGLLHDTVEDNKDITIEQVTKEFGPNIALLVDGVTKLTKASFSSQSTKEEQQAENVRKMFIAMAKDIRVIPIKLADRLHNMRTLEYCRSDKRVRKAQETLEIYSPLAHRLGMGQIKCELEDLSFMHINPDGFEELKEKVRLMRFERSDFLNEAISIMQAKLEEMTINGQIHGRPKHLYSIYRKMQKQGVPFEQVYDLIAIRIIVPSVEDCYSALGMVHSIWRPLPFRIKDYISMPKANGYQSLHTTLIGENGVPFEVQIRTEEMHRIAEFGIAAHWKYKEGRKATNDLDMVMDWVRTLMDEKVEDSGEFMSMLKFDFFSDYVYVFTPNGEIIDLVTGSTPLDFAYRIHSEVGNRCNGAKVNGKIVPLDYKLKMGDIVDIIRSNTAAGPKRDWLNIVETQTAKSKIKQWFKKELKAENIERGKDMLEKEAKKQGYVLSQICILETILVLFRKISINSLEDLYASVGYGSLSTSQVVPRLIEEFREANKEEETKKLIENIQKTQGERLKSKTAENAVVVKGEAGMLVRMARCCTPVPGDDIVGYITRGRGVSVHRSDCKNLTGLSEGQVRFIDVEWATKNIESKKFTANIMIIAAQRDALIMDISKMFMNINVSLIGINAKTERTGKATFSLTFSVSDSDHLNYIINLAKKIASVEEVYRVRS